MAKRLVDEVVILCGSEEIARHARWYAEGTLVADPLHYLALIEMKPGALEARLGNKERRECIQVLGLLKTMPLVIVTDAAREAIRLGAIAFDAVKLIALARIEQRPARRDLTVYPHLPKMDVKTTCAADYAVLAT